ncbi:sulfite exporter TauE/SafE family protein [Variovorax sp. LT1R16]|uniref:sulfite exporter TauE/SafE family protein n=1 Tax=Variovorax sp. LT1R16 TaxID=3443728 RepID=UPI003F448EC4
MEVLTLYAALGIGAGLLSGMLGVGGGQVVVPGLLYLFHLKGFAPDIAVRMALGTSLATIVVTSLSSARAHHRRGSLDWRLVRRLAPGIVVGAVVGGGMSGLFSAQVLRIAFGVFLLILALQMALSLKPAPQRSLPGAPGLNATAGAIGWTSAIVGVGGGSMVVPFLVWCNVNVKTAVGTASACGVPLALAGTVGFLAAGWGRTDLPAYSLGYVYGPAWLGISACSLLATPIGAMVSHRLPVDTLKRAFSVFLAIAGLRILL